MKDDTMYLFPGSEQTEEIQRAETLQENVKRMRLIGEVPPSKKFQKFEEEIKKQSLK